VMNKQVITIFLFNKPETLLFTKPLYCALCQSANLLSNNFNHGPKPTVATLAKETILQTKPTTEVRRLTTVAKFILTFHKGQVKRFGKKLKFRGKLQKAPAEMKRLGAKSSIDSYSKCLLAINPVQLSMRPILTHFPS
jgi:hypothetical protein